MIIMIHFIDSKLIFNGRSMPEKSSNYSIVENQFKKLNLNIGSEC